MQKRKGGWDTLQEIKGGKTGGVNENAGCFASLL